MKKIMLVLLLVGVLLSISITAVAKLDLVERIKKTDQITPKISVERSDTCITEEYDVVENIFGTCAEEYTYTSCLNTTGPETDCSELTGKYEYRCITDTETTTKTRKVCKPDESVDIVVSKGNVDEVKQLDFSDFGPCNYEQKGSCVLVECVAWNDGAHNGQYVPCKPGMSCQRFEICEDSVKHQVRNSEEEFATEDDSFFLSKLALKEVGR